MYVCDTRAFRGGTTTLVVGGFSTKRDNSVAGEGTERGQTDEEEDEEEEEKSLLTGRSRGRG